LPAETRIEEATITTLNSTLCTPTSTPIPALSAPIYINTTTPITTSETKESDSIIAIPSTTHSSTPQPSTPPAEEDGDSLFSDANFLSFEEWKKQNLARSGQSPETLGQGRTAPGTDRSRPGIENSLESLGEDNEIEIDFSGFGGPANVPVRDMPATKAKGDSLGETVKSASPPSMPRSRDAGKTCKERFNYASFDCAANVLKTSPQCKHSSAILVENKDSYMLNKCAADNKFIIVELCDDILVDTIVLANYEFFSSMFRAFRVSVSDKYPVKIDRWKELGLFEARNSRDIQAFLIENPLIWARYLRIEFITHYGSEYYCPVSLLRVHGTTMMAEFRHQEELARGEVDNDDEDDDEAVGAVDVAIATTTLASMEQVTLDPKVTLSAPAKVYEPIFEQPINETTTVRQEYSEETISSTTHSTVSSVLNAEPSTAANTGNSAEIPSQVTVTPQHQVTVSSNHETSAATRMDTSPAAASQAHSLSDVPQSRTRQGPPHLPLPPRS